MGFSEWTDSLSKGVEYVRAELGPVYYGVMAVSGILSLVAIWTSDRRLHYAIAACFSVMYAAWTLRAFSTI